MPDASHPSEGRISPRLIAGLGIVALLLLIQYGLIPLWEWQHTLVRQTLSLKDSVARKKGLIGQEQIMEQALDQVTAFRTELLQRFQMDVTEPQALQLIFQKQVEDMANTFQIKILNVDWLPATSGDILRAPIKFRLEATPEQFLKLVHAIESAPRFHSVDGIRLTTRSKSSTITVEMDVSAYGISKK